MKNRTGWQYAIAGLFIASIAAVISYNDGLFVARLAGNHDRQAFLYPLLADGLIVVGLLALLEAARRGIPRSGWAMAAVLLGVAMTLSMNAGAGVAHSVLDAVIDGLVPVVFFIAVEVVLWHVRRGPRGKVSPPSFTDAQTAAAEALERTLGAGNPLTPNQLKTRFRLTRTEVANVCRAASPQREEEHGNGQGQDGGRQVLRAAQVGVQGPDRPEGQRGDVPHGRQGKPEAPVRRRQRPRQEGQVAAGKDVPAGASPAPLAVPAGASPNGHGGAW